MREEKAQLKIGVPRTGQSRVEVMWSETLADARFSHTMWIILRNLYFILGTKGNKPLKCFE